MTLSIGPQPTFYKILDSIRQRPVMYLGRKSLRDFDAWLSGFRFAVEQTSLKDDVEWIEFQDFDEFVQDQYDWHDVGGWAGKITYYLRDEGAGLDEFFRLLDEFRAARLKPPSDCGN